jgi:ribosomal protein L15
VKILADGTLEKALTIKADSFSIQAIKMIELTGGTPIVLE